MASKLDLNGMALDPQSSVLVRPTTPTNLAFWTDHEWTGGIELERLAGLERFAVRTRNSTYEFTVLSPRTGEVLVRGGRLFPEHVRASVAGCSLGGGCLKVHAIYPGFLMELIHEGSTILTTRVQTITPLDCTSVQ